MNDFRNTQNNGPVYTETHKTRQWNRWCARKVNYAVSNRTGLIGNFDDLESAIANIDQQDPMVMQLKKAIEKYPHAKFAHIANALVECLSADNPQFSNYRRISSIYSGVLEPVVSKTLSSHQLDDTKNVLHALRGIISELWTFRVQFMKMEILDLLKQLNKGLLGVFNDIYALDAKIIDTTRLRKELYLTDFFTKLIDNTDGFEGDYQKDS